jgi:hypothetical protein
MFKGFSITTAMTVLALSMAPATMRAEDRGERSEQTVITSRTFTIPKGQCSQLPADVEIQGVGLERTKTVVTGETGRLGYSRISTITGTATDNFGGKYTFVYHNRLSDATVPGTGIDVDTFKLTGRGVANGMSTFFRLKATLDAGGNPIGFELIEQSGDPFHCDPL